MSQPTVESVVGRLACDEEFRLRFAAEGPAVLDELVANGAGLNSVERRALLAIDPAACTEFAESLDPRIQKVSFRNVAGRSPWSPPPPEPASLSYDNRTAKLVEVVVFVDAQTETAGVLEFASALAQEHGAHLTGVFTQPEPTVTQPEPTVTRPEMFARGGGIGAVIETHRGQLEGIEANQRPCSRTSSVVTGSGRSGDRCPTSAAR